MFKKMIKIIVLEPLSPPRFIQNQRKSCKLNVYGTFYFTQNIKICIKNHSVGDLLGDLFTTLIRSPNCL